MPQVRRPLLFLTYIVIVIYSFAAIEGYGLPFLAGTPPDGPRSIDVVWPSTSGFYLGNTSNFKELDVNITLSPGIEINEGMSVNMSAFGIVSAPVAKGLDQVVVDFLGAEALNGSHRIVQGSSGWGLTLSLDKDVGGYQEPFLVAGSEGLVGNVTTMKWPEGTGGVNYNAIVVAQYANGTQLAVDSSDSIHVFSANEVQQNFRNNALFVIAIATAVGALISGLYRFTAPKKDEGN